YLPPVKQKTLLHHFLQSTPGNTPSRALSAFKVCLETVLREKREDVCWDDVFISTGIGASFYTGRIL
ncbi:hypothetical protein BJ165DRAFT_1512377, partial [Panaeolus papilionaceus]